jgi:predicted RNA polymerase sigma factor
VTELCYVFTDVPATTDLLLSCRRSALDGLRRRQQQQHQQRQQQSQWQRQQQQQQQQQHQTAPPLAQLPREA